MYPAHSCCAAGEDAVVTLLHGRKQHSAGRWPSLDNTDLDLARRPESGVSGEVVWKTLGSYGG